MVKLSVKIYCLLTLFFANGLYAEIWTAKQQVNLKITTPEEFLGYKLSDWHLRHDQINFYFKLLAEQSPRLSIENMGSTHEARAQLSAIITSEKNQQNLPAIVNQRSQIKSNPNLNKKSPLIIWLAYSIHGDEPSGAHAALALAHYLTSSNENWVKALLENTVILVTPTQNPDGLDRYATWVNGFKSKNPVADPYHKEHRQNWPTARFNHYLADLNRDWLFVVHPESQARVAFFHRWQPHLVGDFHEMNSQGYFFQPGVPTRTHPLINKTNQQLTTQLTQYHKKAFDKKKQTYFTKEIFDDFFLGKGSSYPDINGSIGILFEQGSVKGQVLQANTDIIDFKTAIENHFTASISTLRGGFELKEKLINYQINFFKKSQNSTKSKQGFLIKSEHDWAKLTQFSNILKQHHIQFFYLTETIKKDKDVFHPKNTLFIPSLQPQKQLINALFEIRTQFSNETFYDVSSFNLYQAFGLEFLANVYLKKSKFTHIQPKVEGTDLKFSQNTVAALIDWRSSSSAPLLQALLNKNIRVKFATRKFTVNNQLNQKQSYPAGTLVVEIKQFKDNKNITITDLISLGKNHQVPIQFLDSFSSLNGRDLGSPSLKHITPVRPLILAGKNTNATEVGEIWHYLDQRLNIKVPLIDLDDFASLDISDHSHIFFTSGNYQQFNIEVIKKLTDFLHSGGIIFAQKNALVWLNQQRLLNTKITSKKDYIYMFNKQNLHFKDKAALQAKINIGGVIVQTKLDFSHPLSFGINSSSLTLLKDSEIGFEPISSPFIQVAEYAKDTVLSGYLPPEYQSAFSQTPAIIAEPKGKGSIIAMTDNPLFRNTWLASQKIIDNALYFSGVISHGQ